MRPLHHGWSPVLHGSDAQDDCSYKSFCPKNYMVEFRKKVQCVPLLRLFLFKSSKTKADGFTVQVHCNLRRLDAPTRLWPNVNFGRAGNKNRLTLMYANMQHTRTSSLSLPLSLHVLPFSPSLPQLFFVLFWQAIGFDTWKGHCASMQDFSSIIDLWHIMSYNAEMTQ